MKIILFLPNVLFGQGLSQLQRSNENDFRVGFTTTEGTILKVEALGRLRTSGLEPR